MPWGKIPLTALETIKRREHLINTINHLHLAISSVMIGCSMPMTPDELICIQVLAKRSKILSEELRNNQLSCEVKDKELV